MYEYRSARRVRADSFSEGQRLLLSRLKLVFAGAAVRADPIIRQVLELRAGSDAVFRVTNSGIVDIATHAALVLLQCAPSFSRAAGGRLEISLGYSSNWRFPETKRRLDGLTRELELDLEELDDPEEPVFFANADTLREAILEMTFGMEPPPRAVILDVEVSGDTDVPGADMIAQLAADLDRAGIELYLTRVHPDARAALERTGVLDTVAGSHRRTIDAVHAARGEPGT